MNVSEANRINVLLNWLFETPTPSGPVPTHEQGMAAAAYLADHAHAFVHDGWTGDQVRKSWYWHDTGGDTARTAQ